MRNPILVFLSSVDHHGRIGSFSLSKVYSKIGIYKLMYPYYFEHYCVFCRRFTDDWWDNDEQFDKRLESIRNKESEKVRKWLMRKNE
jgi:hypothetical protein